MTRIPSDRPGRLLAEGSAERVVGSIRRHLLAAAEAGLRVLREWLARVPAPAEKTTGATAPSPKSTYRERTMTDGVRPSSVALDEPPRAELLRSDVPLPASYGTERIVLLARDPHCLFAYWDLSDEHRRSVRARAGSASLRLILRAYDVTQVSFDAGPSRRFQDFAVGLDAPSVYAYIGKPAACFVAEIGYLRSDGAFFLLARSQPVWTPRTEQPGSAPGRWMTVGWNERSVAGEPATAEAPQPSGLGALTGETAPGAHPTPSSWPGSLPLGDQRGSWNLVRGGLIAATPPDETPSARSET